MKIDHSKDILAEAFGLSKKEVYDEGGKFIKALDLKGHYSEAMEEYFGIGHNKEFWLKILGFKMALEFITKENIERGIKTGAMTLPPVMIQAMTEAILAAMSKNPDPDVDNKGNPIY